MEDMKRLTYLVLAVYTTWIVRSTHQKEAHYG